MREREGDGKGEGESDQKDFEKTVSWRWKKANQEPASAWGWYNAKCDLGNWGRNVFETDLPYYVKTYTVNQNNSYPLC